MPDDNGTEATRSDAPSADESLFGEAAEDTEAAVADEQDAAQDPQGADDAQAQDGAPEDLKVVVSIKGGRATIGVQQPSSDPHIESFDDLDASGLARGGPGGGRKGEGQVGGRTEVSCPRETRSPGQTPDRAWPGVGPG